jgi:hypothetical protein
MMILIRRGEIFIFNKDNYIAPKHTFLGRLWIHVYKEERLNIFTLLEYEELKTPKPSYMLLGLPDTGLVGVIAS